MLNSKDSVKALDSLSEDKNYSFYNFEYDPNDVVTVADGDTKGYVFPNHTEGE